MAEINRYLAFAEWRIATHRSSTRSRSIRFFRTTRDHTVIWMIVMRGHYAGQPPNMQDCIAAVRCSKVTARHIITLAIALGFLQVHASAKDARRKEVAPSRQTVLDFERMVDGYFTLSETFGMSRSRKKSDKN